MCTCKIYMRKGLVYFSPAQCCKCTPGSFLSVRLSRSSCGTTLKFFPLKMFSHLTPLRMRFEFLFALIDITLAVCFTLQRQKGSGGSSGESFWPSTLRVWVVLVLAAPKACLPLHTWPMAQPTSSWCASAHDLTSCVTCCVTQTKTTRYTL